MILSTSQVSYQLSAISYQLSVISYQLSAISYQLSAYALRARFAFGHATGTVFEENKHLKQREL
ncbi:MULTISPECIES: hypothetical protein [unclassified Moorena]|uniref:hypothetical protein n=1 Tax=unclassified Moorena TaxID=2683338 RepID=UPI000A75452F|nr:MULTISPECIES: hypothetical protein [unclassified Moorena]NEQ16797.1 hypothetical protein [Moorena sp. SIO3E2]NES41372.1 hypothetical protein [Moorena sp. SIO2C4]